MSTQRFLTAVLAISAVFWLANNGRADDDSAPPDGVEVLARGPIHEAYAEPVDQKPLAGKTVPKEPPPIIEEVPPDQKPDGDNVEWLPGYWSFDDDRADFIWVSGIWRIAPPGRQWLPGAWNATDGGWQWTPGFWSVAQQNEVQYLPAPPAPLTAAPSTPSPGADSSYIPGIWVYRDTRYVWRPGYWMTHRPGWIWVPAHYAWTPAGYVYVEGYWDFELDRRGLLFAPVYFNRPLWTQAAWTYQPRFCIHTDFVFGSLFVRVGYGQYYFGDYFDAGYANRGFTAWVNVRGGLAYDPLFNYYRWSNRENREWLGGMRDLYAGRFDGRIARPPQTLVQQTTIINNNKTVINNVNVVNNVNYVAGIAPLARMNREVVNLKPVTPQERTQFQKTAKAINTFSQTRVQTEAQAIRANGGPNRTVVRTMKIDPPRPVQAAQVSVKNQPPPPAHVSANVKVEEKIRTPNQPPPRTPSQPPPPTRPTAPVKAESPKAPPAPKPGTEKPKVDSKPKPKEERKQ
jgi:hypothetical protein